MKVSCQVPILLNWGNPFKPQQAKVKGSRLKTHTKFVRYRWNHFEEPVFVAGPKPLLTEFWIHHRMDCLIPKLLSLRKLCFQNRNFYLWHIWLIWQRARSVMTHSCSKESWPPPSLQGAWTSGQISEDPCSITQKGAHPVRIWSPSLSENLCCLSQWKTGKGLLELTVRLKF